MSLLCWRPLSWLLRGGSLRWSGRPRSVMRDRQLEDTATQQEIQVQQTLTHWANGQKSKNASEHPDSQAQLKWAAEVVQYVDHVNSLTTICRGAKKSAPQLRPEVLVFGPLFIPPSYLHMRKQGMVPDIGPETGYLKPLHIIHPFFYPVLVVCPHCDSEYIGWEGWTSTGPHEVHGLFRDETALGVRLECRTCKKQHDDKKAAGDKGRCSIAQQQQTLSSGQGKITGRFQASVIPHCTVDLSMAHSYIEGMPYFLSRAAVTRDLFDFLLELRPSSTSRGLSENIKCERSCQLNIESLLMGTAIGLRTSPASLPQSKKGVHVVEIFRSRTCELHMFPN